MKISGYHWIDERYHVDDDMWHLTPDLETDFGVSVKDIENLARLSSEEEIHKLTSSTIKGNYKIIHKKAKKLAKERHKLLKEIPKKERKAIKKMYKKRGRD